MTSRETKSSFKSCYGESGDAVANAGFYCVNLTCADNPLRLVDGSAVNWNGCGALFISK
jgi:hypothetical protein